MRSASFRLTAPLLAASTVLAQFVSPPEDLIEKEGYAGIKVRYKEVPTGICELDPNVKSFSGYADVSEDQHIFWWFFEARNNPKDAPLTVWINGGPGSSSMIGLFQELGPCGVGPDLKPFNNPYSWTNVSNMLFIDQPTMVGFSYSTPVPAYTDGGTIIQLPNNTCPEYAQSPASCGTYSKVDHTRTANDTANGAPNMWSTLQGFMGAFPEYSSNGFHFATESYGGHYAPIYNAYILDQNEKDIPGAHAIDLQSVLIGNGWFDPIVQFPAYYDYAIDNSYDNNLFNESVLAEWQNNLYGEGNCLDQTKLCAETGWNSICQAADNFCYEKVEYLWDIYSGRSEYDMRELDPDPFPYGYFSDYLQKAEIQKAVGAFTNFSFSSSTVGTTFGNTGDDARESGTYAAMKQILDAGVQLMLYFGDSDYICNWIGGEVVADNLNATGFSEAGYVNITTSDGIVHGQVKQADLFSFVRIYEAGHEVPFYQPLASLEVFERALKNLDVATGKEDITQGHITEGTPTSEYREGNGTVQYELTPANATYNTMLNAPDPEPTWAVESPPQKLRKRQLGKMEHPRRHARTKGVAGGHRMAHRGL